MTFWRTYYHLVWVTKNRLPLIEASFEAQLYAYLRQKASNLEVTVYEINGMPDHVHMIVSIPPRLSVSLVVKNQKGSSAHHFNTSGHSLYWQRGFSVFSLGERQRGFAENYVRRQKEHHASNEINTWLERVDADDLTPEDKAVREETAKYADQNDSIPF